MRQLKLLGLQEEVPPANTETWNLFLQKIEKTYVDIDQERYLTERSLEISSKEMQKRWQSVKLLEEQWRSLSECSPDLIIMTNLQGQITFANKSRGSFSKDELMNKELKSLYPDEHQNEIQELISVSLEKRMQTSTDFLEVRNNKESWFSLRINPILKEGLLAGIVVVESDVTEVRKMAQEVEARLKAEEAVETKARFLANMSHEIRTPLNGILGMAELLNDQITGDENHHKLSVIQSCGETLLALINDILDFSKLEAGKINLENSPFELFTCIKDTVDLLSPKSLQKGLLLHYKIENSVPNWIFGDTTRVRQILLNLVGNALKFTEKGEILIIVTSQIFAKDTHEIKISVKDTGIGISREAQKKLFQSFSQVDASTTRKFGGTGLGLSICQGLAEAMGGVIGVHSEMGEGSEFYFTIVTKEAPAQSDKAEVLTDDIKSDLLTAYPLRILVAEDNRVNQLVLQGFLRRLGYNACIVSNGIDILRTLEKQEFDLILMDCHMPEMDGFEATLMIRQRWPLTKMKIVAATASTLEDDRKRCIEVGMDDLLAKPITLSALTQILQKYSAYFAKLYHHENALRKYLAEPLIDGSLLMKAFNGLEDVLNSTMDAYLESYPKLINALKAAASIGNFEAAQNITHALKGASSNIYSSKMLHLCDEISISCQKKSLIDLNHKIIELEKKEDQLNFELHHILEKSKTAA